MSWPYSPKECPRCRYLERLDPIAMDLFLLKQRDPETMDPCPCFRQKAAAA